LFFLSLDKKIYSIDFPFNIENIVAYVIIFCYQEIRNIISEENYYFDTSIGGNVLDKKYFKVTDSNTWRTAVLAPIVRTKAIVKFKINGGKNGYALIGVLPVTDVINFSNGLRDLGGYGFSLTFDEDIVTLIVDRANNTMTLRKKENEEYSNIPVDEVSPVDEVRIACSLRDIGSWIEIID